MKRLHVDQDEAYEFDAVVGVVRTTYWYKVRGSNGANLLTSEMYASRRNARRAARAFIASIDPVPVRFTYWTSKGQVTEDIR